MQLDRAIRAPFGDDAKARFQQAHKRLDVVRAEAAADAQPAGRGIAHDELLRIAQIKFGDDLRERADPRDAGQGSLLYRIVDRVLRE